MANYTEIRFAVADNALQQVLIAQLAEEGFEGFEETETTLHAFIPEKDYQPETVQAIADQHSVSFTAALIESQNWNAVWESNFDPVVVDDFVAIRAGFHPPVNGVELEIVITPKMSFGTGHHATTYLMMQRMRSIDFTGKKVFDFGTGTGVLAILAEKRGAEDVFAVDIDDWSVENAEENKMMNNCSRIRISKAETATNPEGADVILANINKNVILDNMGLLKKHLHKNGLLLLSGLLTGDEGDIRQAAEKTGLQFADKQDRNKWICLVFKHQ